MRNEEIEEDKMEKSDEGWQPFTYLSPQRLLLSPKPCAGQNNMQSMSLNKVLKRPLYERLKCHEVLERESMAGGAAQSFQPYSMLMLAACILAWTTKRD